MPFPVPTEEDFDYVQFNDGTGAAEIVAIHLAIKERADATGHSLASGDYADVWTAPRVWHADDSPVDGRLYLVDVLQKFYDDILLLLDADIDIRWTETASVGSGVWTEASLVTDIGLGNFADLLTGPTNYLPFEWLHECLGRLVYFRPTLRLEAIGAVTTTYRGYRGGESAFGVGSDSTQQGAWDEAIGDSDHSSTTGTGIALQFGVNKVAFGPYFASIIKASTGLGTVNTFTVGVLSDVGYYFQVATQNATSGAFSITINSTVDVNLTPYIGGHVEIPGAVSDFDMGATDSVSFFISSPLPATVPIAPLPDFVNGYIRATVFSVFFYIDLSGELADQQEE